MAGKETRVAAHHQCDDGAGQRRARAGGRAIVQVRELRGKGGFELGIFAVGSFGARSDSLVRAAIFGGEGAFEHDF